MVWGLGSEMFFWAASFEVQFRCWGLGFEAFGAPSGKCCTGLLL